MQVASAAEGVARDKPPMTASMAETLRWLFMVFSFDVSVYVKWLRDEWGPRLAAEFGVIRECWPFDISFADEAGDISKPGCLNLLVEVQV